MSFDVILEILEGKELVSADSNGLSDPFCTVKYKTQKVTTAVRYKTLTPIWNEKLFFNLDGNASDHNSNHTNTNGNSNDQQSHHEHQPQHHKGIGGSFRGDKTSQHKKNSSLALETNSFTIKVYDKDLITSELLGKAVVPLSQLVSEAPIWVDLKGVPTGKILIKATFFNQDKKLQYANDSKNDEDQTLPAASSGDDNNNSNSNNNSSHKGGSFRSMLTNPIWKVDHQQSPQQSQQQQQQQQQQVSTRSSRSNSVGSDQNDDNNDDAIENEKIVQRLKKYFGNKFQTDESFILSSSCIYDADTIGSTLGTTKIPGKVFVTSYSLYFIGMIPSFVGDSKKKTTFFTPLEDISDIDHKMMNVSISLVDKTPSFMGLNEQSYQLLRETVLKRKRSFKYRIFGLAMNEQLKRDGESIPLIVSASSQFLRNNNAGAEGIFRQCSAQSEVSRWRKIFDSGEFKKSHSEFPSGTDPILVASLLKLYLRELPEPLIPFDQYRAYLDTQGDVSALKNLIQKQGESDGKNENNNMKVAELETLKLIILTLRDISNNSQSNKMTPQALAICVAPNILRNKNEDSLSSMNDIRSINLTIESLINNAYDIFI